METSITHQKENLPNSSGILAMSIVSLAGFCFVFSGVVSITLAIISLVLAKKSLALYNESPERYSLQSLKNIKTGKVCSIISLCLGSLWVIGVLIYISIVGFALGTILSESF